MGYQPELIGGHLAVDLVNTVAWRLDDSRRVDRLVTAAELANWCAAVGLNPDAASLQQVRDVRETTYRVLRPVARGELPTEPDLEALRHLVVEALAAAEPPRTAGVRLLDWEAGGLVATLGLAAARLLEREDLTRLRECSDDDCGWLFLDRSKNGSRRWCSSADCGNRARAKRHYQKVRGS
ncbi:putative RNA-binding Zn ribbon-like protein [Kribbella voronezhensis]|uniref:Putative RNA-binding Zn ribbon-like protein n=1 Tax=Kribbella voronezhensis TaxID=2512212 RepID=A0A4V3FK83_9ACTN|nr:CGNR zinc finger domain-containing protein [Kribbella voronezhensis]TDU89153.1 putative RNA-binding Zn ribbon-like protein [Kribbella voronezhensis]